MALMAAMHRTPITMAAAAIAIILRMRIETMMLPMDEHPSHENEACRVLADGQDFVMPTTTTNMMTLSFQTQHMRIEIIMTSLIKLWLSMKNISICMAPSCMMLHAQWLHGACQIAA